MNRLTEFARAAWPFLLRRSVFFVIGAGLGYAYGYGHGSANAPSLMQRALSVVGVSAVKDDHVQRQQAIEAMRQARMDSVESAIHP